MPTKKAGGTFVGDATNLLIPIGLLAAREGIQWYKGSKSAKAIVPSSAAKSKKPAAAAKAKPAPKPKAKKSKKRSVRGGADEEEAPPQGPSAPSDQNNAGMVGQGNGTRQAADVQASQFTDGPAVMGPKEEDCDIRGGAKKKKSKASAKKPTAKKAKAADPKKVIKMARAAIKGHIAKRGGAEGIIRSFVEMADMIGR